MRIRSRLRHAAAGMLASLLGRNNDIEGYWAPGLLYRELGAPPHTVEIDLLAQAARPPCHCGALLAQRYSLFLRAALAKHQFDWTLLAEATIVFQFKVDSRTADVPGSWRGGDPFICSVSLRSLEGHLAAASARSACWPWQAGAFSHSGRAGRLS
ncbi:hypothetical protein [Massilia sp. DWR3-1-1]|uniref:hypothetical protein n=1 Tax=Massilia sp. DWR3-1-1 TaxID=2804559 RepID=UPI003CF1E6BA